MVASFQLLQIFTQELMNLEPEARKDVAQYALAQIQPRVVSFEEQDHAQIHHLQRKLQEYSFFMADSFPESRCSHTATVVGSKIFVFGGSRDGKLLNDVQLFDTASGRWTIPRVLGTPPAPRSNHSAVLLNGERILVFGGNCDMPQDNLWFLEVDTSFIRLQRQLLGMDVVAWSKGMLGSMPQPVVICGPSGVGKGTLITRLMNDFPDAFGFSVSHTTRLPRDGERSGIHYHFTERKDMQSAIQDGKFLESADVHGNLYGTSIAAVEAVADAGKRCILDIDVQGAQSVKKSGLDALFIFIAPPSFEQLESRLRGRGTETEEQIQKRLRNAKAELEQGQNSSLFNHCVVNDDLEECYLKIKKLLRLDGRESNVIQNGSQNSDLFYADVVELQTRFGHSASVVGQNVYLWGGRAEGGPSSNLIVLDTSYLAGGAPVRTTGLRCSTLDLKWEISNGVIPAVFSFGSRSRSVATKDNHHSVIDGGASSSNVQNGGFH